MTYHVLEFLGRQSGGAVMNDGHDGQHASDAARNPMPRRHQSTIRAARIDIPARRAKNYATERHGCVTDLSVLRLRRTLRNCHPHRAWLAVCSTRSTETSDTRREAAGFGGTPTASAHAPRSALFAVFAGKTVRADKR